MKREISPVMAGVVVVILLALIGGLYWWGQRTSTVPSDATAFRKANGKLNLPTPAGGGGSSEVTK